MPISMQPPKKKSTLYVGKNLDQNWRGDWPSSKKDSTASRPVGTNGMHTLLILSTVWVSLLLGLTQMYGYGEGYDYVSTYVDDFLITAEDPWPYMKQLQEVYKIKDPDSPTTYLGALYTRDPSGNWTINCKNYIQAALTQVQQMIGCEIREERTPCATADHPEEGQSEILCNKQHREYQSMAGMAQWLTTLGRLDICYVASSLS